MTEAHAPKRLPVLGDRGRGTLRQDGSRIGIYVADVNGRFHRFRDVFMTLLVGIYMALPWIPIGGHPAVLLDVVDRHFYFFGRTYNAQDTWLAFFWMTGVAFMLVIASAVLGRVWCGYACPQTVFLDVFYRRIERWIEGSREAHMRRDAGPATFDRTARKVVKHVAFFVLSLLIAHGFLAYFVTAPGVFAFVSGPPSRHLEAFIWMSATTLLFYGNFAFFREQLCLIICPYGRLQSVLADDDTLTIGYDAKRGEPRGKKSDPNAGACVDCNRCVVVCPTGIDIRRGQQLDCIGCSACVDACDEVMDKLEWPRGLVRYDSLRGLRGEKRRIWRPRLVLYAGLIAVGVAVSVLAMASRRPFEANLLRLPGAPYVLVDGRVRDAYEVHLVNKDSAPRTFDLSVSATSGRGWDFTLAERHLTLPALGERRVPVFASIAESEEQHGTQLILSIATHGAGTSATVRTTAPFLGPR